VSQPHEKFLLEPSRKFRFDGTGRNDKAELWMSSKDRERLKVLHEVRKRTVYFAGSKTLLAQAGVAAGSTR
jgi:hypothetical protein